MFDPRDDARDREGREDGREGVYERDRDDDPREGLMHDLDLPRGEEREMVAVRDHVYELNGEDSRTLAGVGVFRVVPEHDLDIDHDTVDQLRDEGLVERRQTNSTYRASWRSQNAFCRAHQTCGYRPRSTTSSGCRRCSFRTGSRTTEFGSIEPP